MKKKTCCVLIGSILCSFLVLGCGQTPSRNSVESIQRARTISGTKAQTDFLLKEANQFFESGDYDEVLGIAEYIQKNLKRSREVRDLIRKVEAIN